MASILDLDSCLGQLQLEEQWKTMVGATRRLLDTVNAIKDTGELLLQIIKNHQKMLVMSRGGVGVKNLMNDAKREIKTEAISDKEVDWGDNSPPTPQPSEDWGAEADYPPF